MVHNAWLRPKTSSGLPSTNNDSSSLLPANKTSSSSSSTAAGSAPLLADNTPSLSSRRSTHDFSFYSRVRPSSGYSSYNGSTDNSAQLPHSRNRFKAGIDEARVAFSAMARKALQGNRDMRPVDRLSTHDSSLGVVGEGSSSSSSTLSSLPPARPSSSVSTTPRLPAGNNKSGIRRFKSLRDRARRSVAHAMVPRSQLNHGSDAEETHITTPMEDIWPEYHNWTMDAAVASPSPSPSSSSSLPWTAGGAPGSAARASAAEHNYKAHVDALAGQQHVMDDEEMSDDMRTLKKRRAGKSGCCIPIKEDGELVYQYDSVVDADPGVDEFTDRRRSKPPARTDLIGKLPTEIAAAILSYLDDNALTRCLKVSHRWREVASSPAVWRSSFLGRYARAEENVLPYIQFGGQGLGQRANQPQEWQRMCAARRKIEKNWKTEYPKAVYFVGHTDSVYCCQFDEDKIITGSRDRTIRVWDLNHPYKCRKVIGGPAARPQRPTSDVTLETHPTNTFHQTRSLNGTPEGDAIYHVPSDYHTASILCLQFDEEIMVTGSSDHSCIVWDIHTYEPIRRLLHHSAGVLDVCMDDKYIISCSKDAHICVWDRKTFTLIKALHGHRGPVNAVQLREIGGKKLLVSASGDGLAKIWDLAKLDVVKQFNSQDRGLAAVEFSDDGKFVLAGGNDQVIYKFDVHTTELVHTFRGHSSLVRSLFLDSANSRVVSGSYDQGIRVYDFHSGELVGSYDNWTTSWILAAKGDYRRIVATSQDGRALLMDFGHAVQDVGLLGARATLPAVPAVPVAPWEARRALPPSSVVAVTDEMVGFEHLGSVV